MASLTGPRGGYVIEFRRTQHDSKPPSRILTPRLMGDPAPDREARSEELRKSLTKPARGDQGIPRLTPRSGAARQFVSDGLERSWRARVDPWRVNLNR
jgi:hypothetical protein